MDFLKAELERKKRQLQNHSDIMVRIAHRCFGGNKTIHPTAQTIHPSRIEDNSPLRTVNYILD